MCLHCRDNATPSKRTILQRFTRNPIMDCTGCHTPGTFLGKPDMQRPLAGSEVGFGTPGLGIFYPPNLTPDPETGLGQWTEADIVKAVRTGERPDGRELAPMMPWRSYAALTDDDALALAAYLKSLPSSATGCRHPPARTRSRRHPTWASSCHSLSTPFPSMGGPPGNCLGSAQQA